MRKKNKRRTTYIIKGDIWFGNRFFHYTDYTGTIQHNNKQDVKREFFKQAWNIVPCESLILMLNKFIPIINAKIKVNNNGDKGEEWFNLKTESIGGESKTLFLEKIVNEQIKFKLNEFSKCLRLKTVNQARILKNQGYKVAFNKTIRTAYRLVVGLGSTHVLETSLTLHHIFGIPYIPGTALKGVVRMVSFWEIAKNKDININNDKDLRDLQKQLYEGKLSDSKDEGIVKHKLLFGTQGFKGLLVFLDAYPEINENEEIFELDIMNVHYKSYYSDKGPPGDWENPNPITFLTVKKGIPFRFYILFDEFRARKILEDKNIPGKIKEVLEDWINNPDGLKNSPKEWIKIALTEFGVGAKTRLGYGIFEDNF